MENLEKLSKLLRYAGLNLTPQMLQVVLDANVRNLIDKFNAKLTENPNPSLEDIDGIIDEIQIAAQKQEEAKKAAEKKAVDKGKKLEKA